MFKYTLISYREKDWPFHIFPVMCSIHDGITLGLPLCGCDSLSISCNHTFTGFKEFDLADVRLGRPDICKNCKRVRKKLLRQMEKHDE